MLVATVLLYLSLAGCTILAIVLVMHYDLHRREPWYTMLLAIVLGGAAMYGCMRGQEAYIVSHPEFAYSANWKFALLAGACEEAIKVLVVVVMALLFRRVFDEALDGLIYGSLAGLGAAVAESVHVLGMHDVASGLPREEPVRLLGHLIMGGIGGFGIGLMIKVARKHIITAIACFVAAIALHVTWDMVAFHIADVAHLSDQPQFGYTAISIGIMLCGFMFFSFLVRVCHHCDGVPSSGIAEASAPLDGTRSGSALAEDTQGTRGR